MIQRLLFTLVAFLTSLFFILPILWMLSSALRPQAEIFRTLSPLSVEAFLPTTLDTSNFQNLLQGNYPRAVLNSVVVASGTVVIGLLISSAAAFGLSAIEFRGREVVFAIVVISFMVPFEVISIPLAQIVRENRLNNSFVSLILPGVANGLAIFLLRQFFLGIPRELIQAAQVDGAGWWKIFYGIFLPLSKPALIGAGLILFIWQWQSYLWPLMIISDNSMDVAPVALAKYMGQFDFDFGQMFAGAVILSLIPTLILLPLQRYFTQSITLSGIKE